MATSLRALQFTPTEQAGAVSALLLRPTSARALLVLGHGAGAGMRHPFMQAVAEQLAAQKIATFRYQFPYMEKGKKSPDSQTTLRATIVSAVETAKKAARGLPLLAGGKSMGGRLTSLVTAEGGLPDVRGLIFYGFPLHAAGKPSSERGAHLAEVDIPMLFLQGTRDRLAELACITPLCRSLGKRATLHIVEGGDHSFHVLKRSGRTDEEVQNELGETVGSWVSGL